MDNIEEVLLELPDKVADALGRWRVSTLDRERVEALLFASIKGKDEKKSSTEIKMEIHESIERYNAVLHEIKQECEYNRLYEKLLSAKKRASLRTAF